MTTTETVIPAGAADRGALPAHDWIVGGRPAWDWSTIEQWARDTGRLA